MRTCLHCACNWFGIYVHRIALPSYDSEKEFRSSVVRFYNDLIAELEHRGEPTAAINVIRRSGLYCWDKEYEYKVSWPVFEKHIIAAGLQILDISCIWTPQTKSIYPIGTFALKLKPKI